MCMGWMNENILNDIRIKTFCFLIVHKGIMNKTLGKVPRWRISWEIAIENYI